MTAADEALDAWLQERTREGRDRLIASYAYLRRRGARKFCRPGLEREDLEQIAAIGFLKACDRYDARLKTPFEAFAWLFIVGELMHYVRDYERLVRAPRRVRSLERRVQDASELLLLHLERTPTQGELASHLGVGVRDLEDCAVYRERAVHQSLDAGECQRNGRLSYTLGDREDRVMLDTALSSLTLVERTIILAFYASGYTQNEIAGRLGYSRRHISRLHRSALAKMKPYWVSTPA